MAISNLIVWECRKTGNATNGGGFRVGASGTDWSQQDTPQYSVTDGVTNGTSTITSATANFGADVVGNLIYISGGTGSITAGWYEIISRTNNTTIVVDRATGLTSGTGVTLRIGGAVDSPVTINNAVVAGNLIYIKKGASAYNLASTLTLTGGTVGSGISKPTVWVGYDTTRTVTNTDTGPTFSSNNNALSPCVTVSNYTVLRNVIIDGSGTTKAARGIAVSGSDLCIVDRCKVNTFTDCGILGSGTATVINCYVTGGTSAASNGAFLNNNRTIFLNCVADNNANVGFQSTSPLGQAFIGCVSINNTTANGHGFLLASSGSSPLLLNCVAYNNAGDGIRITGSFTECMVIRNCLLVINVGYGINSATGDNRSTSGTPAGTPFIDYNAFYNNSGGIRNNLDAGAHDISLLSASPFTNAAGGDFSLNNTAGAGAACRAAGFPGTLLGLNTTGYLDLGVIQHQDSGGGSIVASMF